MFSPLILWGSRWWGRQWFMWGQYCWRQQMEAKCNKNPVMLYSLFPAWGHPSLLGAGILLYIVCRRKLELVPVAKDKWKTRTEMFFLDQEKGWPLSWLEVPSVYTCLSEVRTEKTQICWKQEMAGVVKSSWLGCLFSYDVTVEGEAGCSVCRRRGFLAY